jgi:glycosyltransferase involved in cell wall biosynthesis
MQQPRVLIFGQPFNDKYGGGITLSNLFKGWTKDRIAVAAIGHTMHGVTSNICNNYFQLGKNEYKWTFPFNLLQRQFPSGRIAFEHKSEAESIRNKHSLRYTLVNQVFYPFLGWLGLLHSLTKIKMSPGFKEWLLGYEPDILYVQVSTRDSVLFASQLIDYLKIPATIHIMDDWPSTISSKGLFKKYWANRIDREFRVLLRKVDLALSISDAMSDEYLRRYGKSFTPFHNPVEISKYKELGRVVKNVETRFRILYLGRIGIANKATINHFAEVISELEIVPITIDFDIYTSDINTPDSLRLGRMSHVSVNPAVSHEDVPALLPRYDLLLLPLDFTYEGLMYARYSIPTKASEYMASGVPILVYAPEQTAISQFCAINECGHCVTELDPKNLLEAIQLLINNEAYRKMLSSNAVTIAFKYFDANKIRQEFHELLSQLSVSSMRSNSEDYPDDLVRRKLFKQ